MTPGIAVLFDTSSVRLHMRAEVELQMSDGVYDPNLFGVGEGGSLFQANQVQWLLEGRADLEVSRPVGIVEITLTAGA